MLIVYVGAVAVLFLFVVMMLNVSIGINNLFENPRSYNHLPIGFIISLVILFINDKNIFIIFAIFLSSFFGPIQSASRVYFAKSIPDNKKYEFFGFYSFSGKVTAFIGPVLYGTMAYTFSSPKIGMASLLILFLCGLIILTKVDNDIKQA